MYKNNNNNKKKSDNNNIKFKYIRIHFYNDQCNY